jgi:ABC-type nickel/cobalt efflux system permease component RcnA
MRRVALLALLALLALPAAARAHPLGNFSVNHIAEVSASSDRIDVRYVLDEAEIPTFQERGLTSAQVLARKRAEVARALTVTVDGRPVALHTAGPALLTHPPGQGGLSLTRVVLQLTAPIGGVPAGGTPARATHRVVVRDGTFPGRVGWKAVVPRPGRGTAVRADAPAQDPTGGLRRYPADVLRSPADQRVATLVVAPGAGTLSAPGFHARSGGADVGRGGAGLAQLFSAAAAGRGVLVLLLAAAFGWGMLHALSPGHGKAMVAAYLVGTRGTARHAVGLGLTVTVTHTAGVVALGIVALGLSAVILPEQLYPWLNLVSGLLVVAVGVGVLRARLRHARAHAHHHHHHDHHHAHETLSRRSLLAMGASAGLIPCPTALVVLLAAVAQHQIPLGLLLIVAFSAGLATTLVGLGLAVVGGGRLLARLPAPGRLTTALPAVSAFAIVAVGVVLTAQALPKLG